VLLTEPTSGDTATQDFYHPMRDPHDRGPTTAARMQRYEVEAARLACRAAAAALDRAGVAPDQVTHLVSVSCSGFSAPGFDLELIAQLPLPAGTARTHVGFMGCHGLMNGLRVAKAFAQADRRSCVLLCAVELCSLHHQYGWEDPDRIVANALFADGAAAAVCRQQDAVSPDVWNLVDQASIVIEQTSDLMTWRIGDHGFAMTLSPRVPDTIRQHLRPWLAGWLRHARPGTGRRRQLGRPSRRSPHPAGLCRGDFVGTGPVGRLAPGAGCVRQHVIADRPVHSGASSSAAGGAALRYARLRPRSGCGSRSSGVRYTPDPLGQPSFCVLQ
jgi:hypothetical protein